MDVKKDSKICQNCKKRKEKKCTVTDEFVSRKKSCSTNQFDKKD